MLPRMSRHFLAFALAAVFAPGLLSAQEPAPRPVLRPGDAVRITVWRKPEFTGEFELAPDGSIIHPLYRTLNVASIPLAEVEQRIGAYLQRYETTPQFVVEPLFRVVVSGEVRQPNVYLVPEATTVAQAVGRAGGATERGRLDQVRVLRGTQELVVDLTQPGTAGTEVRSGDHVVVRRRTDVFREYVVPAVNMLAAVASVISIIIVRTRSN